MIRAVLLLLVMSLVPSACGWSESRLNPGNWFGPGGDAPATAATAEPVNPLIPQRRAILSRPDAEDLYVPIETVTGLVVERTTTGAIIRAEGIARLQGAYEARLRPTFEESGPVDGVLEFNFVVLYASNPRPVGPESGRRITVAHSITNQGLKGVRLVRVKAAQNAREVRHR